MNKRDNLREALRIWDKGKKEGLKYLWEWCALKGDEGGAKMCFAMVNRWDEFHNDG